MRIPQSTYRLQFTPEFGFPQATAIAAYLAELGISDLYASPIFYARSGSTHGYDVVDATQLNPELGTPEDFEKLIQEVQSHQLGWLQDIVPNHMAYDSLNKYLIDILENGPDSEYVNYFDICWNLPFASNQDRLLAPFLGDSYGNVLERGELQLHYDENGLRVHYGSLQLPIKLESYGTFLTHNLGSVTRELGRNHPDFIKLLGILYILRSLPSEPIGKQRQDQIAFIKGLLWELCQNNEVIKNFVESNIKAFNGEPGNPESFNLLDKLLSEQFYRLSFWKVGAEEMNYRRFFTVNELICVRVEDVKVFNKTHSFIEELVKNGTFTGLRVDHIDGLYAPGDYLTRLREKMGDTYITVEKILEFHEDIPSSWPIQGTSGYDFLIYLNNIFCRQDSEHKFNRIYTNFTGVEDSYSKIVKDKKYLIVDKNLAGDVDNLASLLKQIASKHRYGNDFTLNGLKKAIAEVLVLFPVYRTYVEASGITPKDKNLIHNVIGRAKKTIPLLVNELNFIEKILSLDFDDSVTSQEKQEWHYFVMRVQQYTGPLMAKGVEDTTFYVYNRLVSLNEVGGSPDRFGISLEEFHQFNRRTQANWPSTMSATATHDTKRGEDVRARLNVLSEIPEQWEENLKIWSEINQQHKRDRHGIAIPDANDEYQLYQNLLGAFPFEAEEFDSFKARMKDFIIKAIREAKIHTAWLRPDSEYEECCVDFVEKILENSQSNEFLAKFIPFTEQVAYYGMFNSLSQILLKITAPGIPDFYQGTEFWEFSLVDPDNRRPVDFEKRRDSLQYIKEQCKNNISGLLEELLINKQDGRVKLFLIAQALKARTNNLPVFENGDYLPLTVEGAKKDCVVAFARRYLDTMAIIIAPRFFTQLIQVEENPLGEKVWQDTHLILPPESTGLWQDAITNYSFKLEETLNLSEVLSTFPVALLVNER